MGSSVGVSSIWNEDISITWQRSGAGGCERQDGGADVAAHLHVPAGLLQDVRDECRGRRLAVGAGDGDERSVRGAGRPLAREQLDVADDLHAGGAGLLAPSSAARGASAARQAPAPAPRTGSSPPRRDPRPAAPALAAASRPPAASSHATTWAPPAASARQLASPDMPRPNTATVRPAKVVTGVIAAL